jgi:hypothetical protein
MNEYLSKEFIEKILDAHLEDSRGAEHYAYGIIKRELMVAPGADVVEVKHAEWDMVVDDFDDGFGNRKYPHCTNCHRGVYRHDAGSWCPFCGAAMKNPMR